LLLKSGQIVDFICYSLVRNCVLGVLLSQGVGVLWFLQCIPEITHRKTETYLNAFWFSGMLRKSMASFTFRPFYPQPTSDRSLWAPTADRQLLWKKKFLHPPPGM